MGLGLTANEAEGSHVPSRSGGGGGGLDGVVLCGRLRGGGSRWGDRGPGCGGCGVLACVWVRVWVRAAPLLLPPQLLSFLGLRGVVGGVLVMFLVVVVLTVLLPAVLSFGFQFSFVVGFEVMVWFEVEEGLRPRDVG